MTDTQTTAARIAARFDGDGRRFEALDTGESLDDVCKAARGTFARGEGSHGHLTRYDFGDGSGVILSSAGAWDLRHPDCTCGWCWTGNPGDPAECTP